MARVVRPGGILGYTHWTAEGFFRDWSALEERFQTGGSEGSSSPILGTESTARAAITRLASHAEVTRQTLSISWSSAGSFADALIEQDPYLLETRRRVAPARWPRFADELRRLVDKWNSLPTGGLRIELPYLQVVAQTPAGRRRG